MFLLTKHPSAAMVEQRHLFLQAKKIQVCRHLKIERFSRHIKFNNCVSSFQDELLFVVR